MPEPATIGAIAAPLIGGAVGFFGQERANATNQAEAQKNRDFQSSQAHQNRQFQERMRNTAWQSAVEDMRAAGLNPALAYSQGPAASPGGSMAGGATAAPAGDSVSSALAAMQQRKTLQLLDAQIKKTDAEAGAAETAETQARHRWVWLSQDPDSTAYKNTRWNTWMKTELGNMIANGTLSLANSNYLNTQARLAPYQSIGAAAGSLFEHARNQGGRSMNRLFPGAGRGDRPSYRPSGG